MKFRTLLLLGFTALAGTLSGCIIETTSGNNSASCRDNQYFNVRWEVDNGSLATMFPCELTPNSHIELTTNTGTLLAVGEQCVPNGVCSDGSPCNWAGSTVGDVPVGTYAVLATLLSDVNGAVLSSATPPPLAIARCTSVDLSFQFPLQ